MKSNVTYEEAKEIALKWSEDINSCNEYAKGYHFYKHYTEEVVGDCGVVVLKETGKITHFVDFILDYHPERNPKKIEF